MAIRIGALTFIPLLGRAAALCAAIALTGCGGSVGSSPLSASATSALESSSSTSVKSASYDISGTVYGAVSANVVVTLNGPLVGAAVTDSSGTYTFSGVPAGTYTVSAALPGYTFSQADTLVVSSANSTDNNFQSAVTPAGYDIHVTAIAAPPEASVGTPYSFKMYSAVSGGRGTYVYQTGPANTGTPPAGLVLDTSGTLSGTPTAAGTYEFEICTTDSYGDVSTPCATTSVIVAGASAGSFAIDITAVDPLPSAIVGHAYSATVLQAVLGGRGSYRYAIGPSGTGTAPPGMTLNAAGALAGTPTTAGTYDFEICATDSSGDISNPCAATSISVDADATYDIQVTAVNPLPAATVGSPYAETVFQSVSGGRGTFSYRTGAAGTGTVPPGLVLNSNGELAGSPTQAGTYAFTLCATDSYGDSSAICAPTSIIVSGGSAPSGTSWVYYNGVFDWPGDYSFVLTPDYKDTSGDPLSGAYDIKATLQGAWGGWLPYSKNWDFDSTGYTKLTFALKPTVAGQTWHVYFVKVGDVPVGIYLNVTDYGPAPVPGVWATYTVPLSDLGVLNQSIYKFCIQDMTGRSSNTWYVDNVGFVP